MLHGNVQYVVVFVPAWMIPPMYHSLRRESVKSTDSGSVTGVKSIRPTWFQDTTATRGPPPSSGQGTPEPMHGLRLMIKEEALIISDQPFFPAVTELAKRGLLSPETWQCNRPRVSLKTSIDVPMLGTIIEQNGDGLLEESHMPVGWPLHIDGAVRQRCIHRDTTLQELDDLLSEYDMTRDLAEINRKAPQWSHKAVWNKWYMEPKASLTLSQMWINAEADITQKTSRSNEIRDSDLRRVASAVTSLPAPQMADSPFLKALGTPTIRTAPAQTGELAQRAVEEWERNVCENKAVAILNKMQEGKTALIKKDGGEMLIAIVLDKPLSEAQALVDDPDDPDAFMLEITKIIQNKHAHPVIAQMLHPDVRDDLPPSECATASSEGQSSHTVTANRTQPQTQFQ